jgi:hypothetical protein
MIIDKGIEPPPAKADLVMATNLLNDDYRAFLNEHGAALDVFLHQGQTRWGSMEEIRALAAHALS